MYMYIYVCMGLSVWYQEICDAADSGEQVLSLIAILAQSIYVYLFVWASVCGTKRSATRRAAGRRHSVHLLYKVQILTSKEQ